MRSLTLLLGLALTLAACGAPQAASPAAPPAAADVLPTTAPTAAETVLPTTAPTAAATVAPTAALVATPAPAAAAQTVTDGAGATLTFAQPPARIACLIDLCVDIVAELGMEPVAYIDELAAQPQFFGERAGQLIRIGGSYFEPSLEDIARARPDLVIGYPSHAGLRDALAATAPLFVMQPTGGYQDAIRYLREIGALTGRADAAEEAAQRFLGRLAAYREQSPKDVTVLFMNGTDFDANFGIDSNRSIIGSLLAEVTTYPWDDPSATETGLIESYSLEKVLEVNPEVLFVGTFMFGGGQGALSEQLAANPLWKEIKAVQDGRVYEVSVPIWITGQGTRSMGLVLDEAMTTIYPDVFPQPLP